MKFALSVLLLILSSSMTHAVQPCSKKKCKPVAGTNTVVITISIDDQGNPFPSVTELLQLKPGHRIVFTGPEEFVIFFKDEKTPFKKSEFKSKDGVVTFKIPEKIFDDQRFYEEGYSESGIKFNYGVRVNGKEYDPPMIIQRGP